MAEKTILSVYLLRPGMREELEKSFSPRIPLANGLEGWFHVIPSDTREPAWYTTIRPYLSSANVMKLRTVVPSGLALIHRSGFDFVVPFGHAWMRINELLLVPDFGRRVALNAVPPDQVLELNSEQVFARWHIARERSPRATSVDAFGVTMDRDLVAALEGIPSIQMFGGKVRGSTSLRLKVRFADISAVLDKAKELYESEEYKKHWPEIDNLTPVKSQEDITSLDGILHNDLASGTAAKTAVLFPPSFRQGESDLTSSIVFGRMSKDPPESPYLQYSFWTSYLAGKKQKPSLANARSTKIHLLDADGEVLQGTTVYQCLGYEVSSNGEPYVLSGGSWYKAEGKFISGVDKSLKILGVSLITLPQWNQVSHEDDYNELCCKLGGMVLFDKKIVHYGGNQSKFEFCDFMHLKKKTLFFAKIPSRSSDCSHLAEQVRRTRELLFSQDSDFRKKLKKYIAKTYPTFDVTWLDSRPHASDWNLCLVLMGKQLNTLPLFARCTISRLAKECDHFGHTVQVACV